MPSKDETLGTIVDLLSGIAKGVSRTEEGGTHLSVSKFVTGAAGARTDRKAAAKEAEYKALQEARAEEEQAWKRADRENKVRKDKADALKAEQEAQKSKALLEEQVAQAQQKTLTDQAAYEKTYARVPAGKAMEDEEGNFYGPGSRLPYNQINLPSTYTDPKTGRTIKQNIPVFFPLASDNTPDIDRAEPEQLLAGLTRKDWAPYHAQMLNKLTKSRIDNFKDFSAIQGKIKTLTAPRVDPATYAPVAPFLDPKVGEFMLQSIAELQKGGASVEGMNALIDAIATKDVNNIAMLAAKGQIFAFQQGKIAEAKKDGGFKALLGGFLGKSMSEGKQIGAEILNRVRSFAPMGATAKEDTSDE